MGTHKTSGIVSYAIDWDTETLKNPRNPLGLFQRLITVDLETMKTVKALPVLEILGRCLQRPVLWRESGLANVELE